MEVLQKHYFCEIKSRCFGDTVEEAVVQIYGIFEAVVELYYSVNCFYYVASVSLDKSGYFEAL